MTDLNQVLMAFATQVADEFPLLKGVLDQVSSGHLTEEQGMAALAEIATTDPALTARFQQVAMEALAPLRQEAAVRKPIDTRGGLLMDSGVGLPKLNPLYEAALVERAQFDGDMPELRSGPMTPGVTPQVGVLTGARSPYAVGAMLNAASVQAQAELKTAIQRSQQMVQQLAAGETAALMALSNPGQLAQDAIDRVMDGRSPLLDPKGYRRGQVPAPRRVATPTGAQLATMSEKDQKANTWRFLSTTAGRRTAVVSIAELVEAKLKRDGVDVTTRPFDPKNEQAGLVLAAHEWTVRIDGPNATQAAFSLIDVAAGVLHKRLMQKLDNFQKSKLILEVMAINTVNVRMVGWAARLLLSGENPVLGSGEYEK